MTARYLDFRQATILRDMVSNFVESARAELRREGADPACLDHEIGFALARAACRLDLDLLNGARATIERLEAVVAEMGARLEHAKLAQAVEREATPAPDPLVGAVAAVTALVEAGVSMQFAPPVDRRDPAPVPHVPGLRCQCQRCR